MDPSDPAYRQAMAHALIGDGWSPSTYGFLGSNWASPPQANLQSDAAAASAQFMPGSGAVQSQSYPMPAQNDPGYMAAQAQLRALGLVK